MGRIFEVHGPDTIRADDETDTLRCRLHAAGSSHDLSDATAAAGLSRFGDMGELLAELSAGWDESVTVCVEPGDSNSGDETGSRMPDGFTASQCMIGRFQVLSEVGRGGMGVVVRAWDSHLCREVAIKILHKDVDAGHLIAQRFVREARIIAKLEHPGITPIYEIGRSQDGRLFIAMRMVQGQSLQHLLATRPADGSDVPRLLKIFDQVCQTVAFAHSHHVVHRDLKPANIMLGEFGVVRVMDWGLAKVLTEANAPELVSAFLADPGTSATALDAAPGRIPTVFETQHGTILGTIAYLPPEQALGQLQTVDERADVFTLGGILCEILTGRPPYVADTPKQAYRLASKGQLDDAWARVRQSGADKRLIELVFRCLQADPDRRLANATELAGYTTAILESDLRQAERDLVRFFDLSLDLFCIAGLDGYFRRLNGNFTRVLGYSEEDLLAQPFVSFVHPEDQQPTVEAVQQLQRGLPIVRFRNRYRTASGAYLTFEWTAKSVPSEGVIYATARDLSDSSGRATGV